MFCLFIDEFPIEKTQRLRRDRSYLPSRATVNRVAQIHHFEHRHNQTALDKSVNGAPRTFGVIRRFPTGFLVGIRFKRGLRDAGLHTWSKHFRIELAAHREHRVADRLHFKAAVGHPP